MNDYTADFIIADITALEVEIPLLNEGLMVLVALALITLGHFDIKAMRNYYG